jgi:sortase A
MKHNGKLFLSYLYTPILIAILGYITIFFAAAPIIQMVAAVSDMVIAKSAPDFSEELNSIFDENTVKATDFVDMSEVAMPLYETQYAVITCERIHLLAPLFWGDSDKVLKQGVGQYIGSFMPGFGRPLLLSGHDSTYFAPLEEIQTGDIIKITTNYGDYEYKVMGTGITSSHDQKAYDLGQNEEELILYTCYPFGALIGVKDQRYFVYADKVKGPQLVQGGMTDGRAE